MDTDGKPWDDDSVSEVIETEPMWTMNRNVSATSRTKDIVDRELSFDDARSRVAKGSSFQGCADENNPRLANVDRLNAMRAATKMAATRAKMAASPPRVPLGPMPPRCTTMPLASSAAPPLLTRSNSSWSTLRPPQQCHKPASSFHEQHCRSSSFSSNRSSSFASPRGQTMMLVQDAHIASRPNSTCLATGVTLKPVFAASMPVGAQVGSASFVPPQQVGTASFVPRPGVGTASFIPSLQPQAGVALDFGGPVGRTTSHDAVTCDEHIPPLETTERNTIAGPFLAQPISKKRSSSVFWKPPPEAIVVCEFAKGPSFTLPGGGRAAMNPPPKAVTANVCAPKNAVQGRVCASSCQNSYVPPFSGPLRISDSFAPSPRQF